MYPELLAPNSSFLKIQIGNKLTLDKVYNNDLPSLKWVESRFAVPPEDGSSQLNQEQKKVHTDHEQ